MFSFAKLQRPDSLTEKDLEQIDTICRDKRVIFLKFFPNIEQDLNVIKKFGYRTIKSIDIPSKTMLIDLRKDIPQLWNSLTSGCKYSIHKSERQQDKIEFHKNPKSSEISRFHALLKDWGSRNGIFVQDIKDINWKVSVFKDESFICNVFNNKGEILGSKFFLGSHNTIFGVHAVTSPLGRKSCGGYKLLWDTFKYFKDLGYEYMDFDGIVDDRMPKLTRKWAGHTFFKKQFNGLEVEYPLPFIKFYWPF